MRQSCLTPIASCCTLRPPSAHVCQDVYLCAIMLVTYSCAATAMLVHDTNLLHPREQHMFSRGFPVAIALLNA